MTLPAPDAGLPRALSIETVAAQCEVSVTTVNVWLSNGRLASIRLGRLRRVLPSQLTAFLATWDQDGRAGPLAVTEADDWRSDPIFARRAGR